MEVLRQLGVDIREEDMRKAIQQMFNEMTLPNVSFEIVYSIEEKKVGSKINFGSGKPVEPVNEEKKEYKNSIIRPLKKGRPKRGLIIRYQYIQV
jgi:hypothetical protein